MVQGQPQFLLSLSLTPNKLIIKLFSLKSPGNKTHSGYEERAKEKNSIPRPPAKLAFTTIYVHRFTGFILEMSTLSDLFFGNLPSPCKALTWIRCWKLPLAPTLSLLNKYSASFQFLFCLPHKGSQEQESLKYQQWRRMSRKSIFSWDFMDRSVHERTAICTHPYTSQPTQLKSQTGRLLLSDITFIILVGLHKENLQQTFLKASNYTLKWNTDSPSEN